MDEYEIYRDECGVTYVVVPYTLTKEEALSRGNKYFKLNKKKIDVDECYARGDVIYFGGTRKPNRWAVYKKSALEVIK